MDFEKPIDEHQTSDIASNNQQVVTQEILDANDEKAVQKKQRIKAKMRMTWRRRHQIFQILQRTCVIIHIFVAPHLLKDHLFPQNHRLQLSDTTREKQQNTICDLILNPKADPEFRQLDAITTTL